MKDITKKALLDSQYGLEFAKVDFQRLRLTNKTPEEIESICQRAERIIDDALKSNKEALASI